MPFKHNAARRHRTPKRATPLVSTVPGNEAFHWT
jgi:hypothetical protein